MEPLKIQEVVNKTPKIDFDQDSGVMELEGMSCSENALGFYMPIIAWIEKYLEDPKEETTVNVKFGYFNTSSSKCILDVLECFGKVLEKDGRSLNVNWYYQTYDEEMQEAGESYSEILGIPFNIEEKDF